MMRDDPIKALVEAFENAGVDFVIAYAQNGVTSVEHSDTTSALGIADLAKRAVENSLATYTKVNGE